MNWGLIKAILILPGTALVYVPGALLWAFADTDLGAHAAAAGQWRVWIALCLAALGLSLAIRTARLLLTHGEGTPAPWDPPRKFVVEGPYRYVRNPMIIGVILMLGAESLALASWPLATWLAIFAIVNAIYFPLSEEKGLERRFGESYLGYKANVPRWIPRLRPWEER